MSVRRIKTFTDNLWYYRPVGGSPADWEELPRGPAENHPLGGGEPGEWLEGAVPKKAGGHWPGTGEVQLDEQVRDWVERTGAIIVHPGQLGIHTVWHDTDMRLQCRTHGLTVLYILEGDDGEATRRREAAGAIPGAIEPGAPEGGAVPAVTRGTVTATIPGGNIVRGPSADAGGPTPRTPAPEPEPEPAPEPGRPAFKPYEL